MKIKAEAKQFTRGIEASEADGTLFCQSCIGCIDKSPPLARVLKKKKRL